MLEKPVKLRGDLICLSDMGGDPEAVLVGSGVGYDDLLARTLLPQPTIADLLDRLAQRTARDFSVTGSQAIRVHHLGMLGYRLSNCGTVGDLLRDWVSYSRIIDYPLASSFAVSGGHWRMTFRPRYPMTQAALIYCYESTFAGFRRSVRNMSGISLTLEECCFPFDDPQGGPDYGLIGAHRVGFGTDAGFVEGLTSELSQLIEDADPAVLRACDVHCRAELLRQADTGYAARIEALLQEAPIMPGLAQIAAMLGESPRSVQRKLAVEGTSFNLLIDTVRKARAVRLLERHVPTKMIAFELGFNDVSSFRRAFRGWSGVNLTQWSRQGSEQGADRLALT